LPGRKKCRPHPNGQAPVSRVGTQEWVTNTVQHPDSLSIRDYTEGVRRLCEKHADKPVTRMEARHVRALRDERSDQPGAANTRLKALKALFAWLWSTHSRRIDPINRSAKAFCHGEPGAMGSSRMPIARNRRAMAAP
jgi:hypothetical protein